MRTYLVGTVLLVLATAAVHEVRVRVPGDIWVASGGRQYLGVGDPASDFVAIRGAAVVGGLAARVETIRTRHYTLDDSTGMHAVYLVQTSGPAVVELPAVHSSAVRLEAGYSRLFWIVNDNARDAVTLEPSGLDSVWVGGRDRPRLELQPGQAVMLAAKAMGRDAGWRVVSSHGGVE